MAQQDMTKVETNSVRLLYRELTILREPQELYINQLDFLDGRADAIEALEFIALIAQKIDGQARDMITELRDSQ